MLTNAKTFPEVWYGLHFCPGVAEYTEPNKEPYRVFISEETAKQMDPTFAGKPVYLEHVDAVNLEKLQNEADGYVAESFYNPADGKHWVKFIVVSDRAKQALQSGYRLSNAYVPLQLAAGGLWHAVEFSKEIINAEYEHLAIVKNPRYEESIILSPEEFKKYNEEKDLELKRLANSTDSTEGENNMGLNFFKRSKIENGIDESTMVELPKSKKEMKLVDVITEMDKVVNMAGYASPEHMVKLHDDSEMSVGELLKRHKDACNELEEMKKKDDAASEKGGEPGKGADDDEDMKKNDPNQDSTIDAGVKSVDSRGGDKHLGNEDDEGEEEMKKKNAREKALRLKNAGPKEVVMTNKVDLTHDKVARGKSRYGSN